MLPPLTQVLLQAHDWRVTHMILGAGVLLALPLVMLLPLGRMTAGSQEWRTLRTAAAAGTTRPWTIWRRAPHQRILGTVRRLLLHGGGGVQRHAALGRLSHRAGLQAAGCRQRVRLCRHALGVRHHRRRLAVGPLRAQTDGNPLLPVHHHRHRRTLPRYALSFAAAGLRLRLLLRPDARRARTHHRRHGGPAVSRWRRSGLRHAVGGARVRRRPRLLGLGPALRADRRLHRLVHAGDLRRAHRPRHRSGSCAACARKHWRPYRPPHQVRTR